jgi:hypothetical protein
MVRSPEGSIELWLGPKAPATYNTLHAVRNTPVGAQQVKGGQYAKYALGHRYHPIDFVAAGFFNHSFHGWFNPYFTRYCTYLIDYLAGAASEN